MNKGELRTEFLKRRSHLSDLERENLSIQIAQKLIDSIDLKGKKVSIFLPIERFLEIDTFQIIDSVQAEFVLPVLQKDKLKHIVYESEEQLKISSWGIPEPQFGTELLPEEMDIVLVPLIAVDLKGNRVGYGKGFYDGFLVNCNALCKFVGLSFFEPVTEIDDVRPGDIPLHHCVTAEQFYTF